MTLISASKSAMVLPDVEVLERIWRGSKKKLMVKLYKIYVRKNWRDHRPQRVKRESFLSTVATGTLRTGDWTEDKFRCNLWGSLARILFLNWLYMNELDYFEIN